MWSAISTVISKLQQETIRPEHVNNIGKR